jgi:hypothetical protein
MSQFTQLLHKGAEEVRDFRRTAPDAQTFGDAWLESLARRMEFASSLEDEAVVEREVDAIGHSIVDSGPLTVGFAPSFHRVLDALQRRRKRSGRRV